MVYDLLDSPPPDAGIPDYDIFYFDPLDLSQESESNIKQRAPRAFGTPGALALAAPA